MPFNGSGTFTLASPESPLVAGTKAKASDLNTIFSDIATGLSNTVTRDQQGRFNDGTASAPGVSFTNETNLGWFRNGAGRLAASIGGAEKFALTSTTAELNLNLTFAGTGRRILGDFSNATASNRVLIQSSTTNGNTIVGAIPNGTGATGQFRAHSGSDPDNTGILSVGVTGGGTAFLESSRVGTGTSLALAFRTGDSGTEAMRIAASDQRVSIGTTTTGAPYVFRVAGGALFSGTGVDTSGEVSSTTTLGGVAAGLMSAAFDNDARAFVGWRNTGSPYGGSAGTLILQARSSVADARIVFATGNGTATERMRIGDTGRVLVGTPSDDGSSLMQINGNLALSGTSRKIRGQFDTSNNVVIENSVTNSTTRVSVVPNGTGLGAQFLIFNSSDLSNSARGIFTIGTSSLDIKTDAIGTGVALPIVFSTGAAGTEAMRITTSQRLLIGTTSDNGSSILQVAGNQDFQGTARRITADFSNATLSNRAWFQTNTTNSSTSLTVAANGTATTGAVNLYGGSDPANANFLQLASTSTQALINSGQNGTGTTKDIVFQVGGSNFCQITTGGNFIAGAQSALATTATDGFLYVPTCAGTPTGTPSSVTGKSPIVIDTTNNRFYFYSSGAWRNAGP